MYKLVICDDEGKTTVVPLIRDEISIGRKEGNTIRLTDRNVSRHHARIVRQNDEFFIEDLGSLVGTKVNGRLLRSEQAPVSPRDQITIGDYSVSIRTDVSSSVPLGRQMNAGEQAGIGKVTPHARLVMLSEPTPGREFDLTADLYVIGRSEEANCRIEDPSMSRAHARLDTEGNQWTISDLDSVHGITVNGLPKDDYVLKAGDVIELGSVQLRFVAPGEPYEYASPSQAEDSFAPAPPKSGPALLYILGGLALVAAAAVVAALWLVKPKLGGDQTSQETEVTEAFAQAEETYDELMESGKDEMAAGRWTEAARMFALALQKEPDNNAALELKNLSIAESDAEKAYRSVLEARREKDWTKAAQLIESIPRSSRYYKREEHEEIAENLCASLILKTRRAIISENIDRALELLEQIGSISEAPDTCRETRDELRQLTERKSERAEVESDGDEPSDDKTFESQRRTIRPQARPRRGAKNKDTKDAPRSSGDKGAKFDLANPYASTGSPSEPTPRWDPVNEARKALRQNNTAKAISILERGGNGRNVLAMLAKLYMQNKNRRGYESVARKFIRLYPNDPKSEQFRSNLRFD